MHNNKRLSRSRKISFITCMSDLPARTKNKSHVITIYWTEFHIKLPRADRMGDLACPQRKMGRRRGAKWYYTAAPPMGNGPGPEL